MAPTGDDAGPGTQAQPWLTIQHAVDTVPAGGTVLVESGTYNELVTITRSGDARAGFITISAALGATPIVDGTNKGIPNQENGLFTLVNVSFVRINGFEVRNYITSQIALEPIGIYIIGRGSRIEITNNRVHNIANTAKSQQANALGIAVYGQSVIQPLSGIVIDHNEVFDLTLDFSESVALSGNVQGFQVTNNQIHDNNNIAIDMAGDEHYVTPYVLDHARNGYVAGNLIYNISSRSNPAYNSLGADGIYVDAAQSIVIERNLVHNCDIGIEVASEHQINHQPLFGQNVFVRDNIVYASNLAGISIGGNDPHGDGGTRATVIANNTFVGDDTSNSREGEFQVQNFASGNTFVNNIASATAQGYMVTSLAPTPIRPVVLDHNLYSSPVAAGATTWKWLGKEIPGFLNWVTESGNDKDSAFADPGFVDAARNNFQLAPGSPAIGTGMPLPLSQTGLFDFAGNSRTTGGRIDIGALQK